MMIREKWELVMPSAQVKVEGSGMRPFLFGTRPSELEEQILRSARDRGWETTRNSFFFFHIMFFVSPLQHSCLTHTPSGCHTISSFPP